jgi:HEAT repeat protein
LARFKLSLTFVLLLAPFVSSWATAAPPTFFDLLEDAPVVLASSVQERRVIDERFVIYSIRASEVLKGSGERPSFSVVQELVFPSDAPSLAQGERRLMLLEPLPPYSSYEAVLPPAEHFRAHAGNAGIRSVELASIARRYLRTLELPASQQDAAKVGVLIDALREPSVAADGVRSLAARERLADLLTEATRLKLVEVLLDRSADATVRRSLLDLIRARRLEALVPSVHTLLAEPPMAPYARRTLAAFGEEFSEDVIAMDLASTDASAREAALDSGISLPVPRRIEFLSKAAREDPSLEVRRRAILLLGSVGSPGIPALGELLADQDQRIAHEAAQALASIGTEQAVASLAKSFENGYYESQVAAIFALQRIGTKPALEVLAKVRANPPDERLRRVIDAAAGQDIHHH